MDGGRVPRVPKTPWHVCWWPGLAPLWYAGRGSGLAAALAFALVVNAAMLGTWFWTELVGTTVRYGVWGVVAIVWLASVWGARRGDWTSLTGAATELSEDLFRRLTTEYLKRNWIEAERLARLLLARAPRDVEARLNLASQYRHTARFDEARGQLDLLARLEAAAPWALEIAWERRELALAEDQATDGRRTDEVSLEQPARLLEAA